MLERLVLGVNCPSKFAVYGGKTYAPSANGIVVTQNDGSESSYWQPTNGLYAIDSVTISSKGVLCFSERRLNVVLHFYSVADRRKLQEVAGVTKVAVQALAFDEEGDSLLALCTTPTSSVKVLTASRYSGFSLAQTVALADVLYTSLVSAPAGFVLTTEKTIVGYASQAGGEYMEWFDIDSKTAATTVTAVAVGSTFVVYGAADGHVYRNFLADSRAEPQLIHTLKKTADGGGGAVTALYVAEDSSVYVAGEDGSLLQVVPPQADSSDKADVIFSIQLPSMARRILPVDDSATALVVGTNRGFYRLDIEESSSMETALLPIRGTVRGEVLNCHATTDGAHAVAVCADGSYVVTDMVSDVNYYYYHYHSDHHNHDKDKNKVASMGVLDSCLVWDKLVLLHEGDHRATVHDIHTGRQIAQLPYSCEDVRPTKCAANPAGHLILFDDRCVLFYCPSDSADFELLPCGYFMADPLVMMSSVINFACGLSAIPLPVSENEEQSEDGAFLVSCNGGEIYLVRTPSPEGGAEQEHSTDSVLLGMWRVDFPILAMLPCHVEQDVINILVHSLDKDTKLYALDRRHGSDPKAVTVRPYFLMRDHESGGRCLALLANGTTVCSAGKDGRVVLRDVSPYQKKLTPIPPSKEKRRPLSELTAWHFANGGITDMVVVRDNKLVCLGGGSSGVLSGGALPSASVVKVLRLGNGGGGAGRAWREPTWHLTNLADDEEESAADEEDDATMSPTKATQVRASLAQEITDLRSQWTEQMQVLDSVEVAVDDLLLEEEKARFQETCADAVFEMRESEYYGQLENQYLQDVIKKHCCDTMEVPRCKVTSVAAPNLEVHNFHVARECRPRLRVAKKMAFLRSLQGRMASLEQDTQHERGFSFQQHHAPLRSSEEDAASPTDETTATLRKAFYAPCNVYTSGRANLQAGILKGLVISLKDAFNREHTLLKQKKQSTLALIDERTHRCVQILKQLGEITHGGGEANTAAVATLFAARVDKEEDPSSLFSVNDDELDAAVRALIPRKQGAVVYSLENEAALKLWMDGLEKDVEQVRVTLPIPDFADETKDTFVPLDERTDEQVRLYEEYEKKLKEETEAVEARKDALRNELKSLQKLNCTTASELDESLSRLRTQRVDTAERIDETELHVVQLGQQFLKAPDALRRLRATRESRDTLIKQVRHLEAATDMKQHAVSRAAHAIDAAEEDVRNCVEEVQHMSPFTDETHGDKLLRRFGRWKRKFDDGKADMPKASKPPEDCLDSLWTEYCEHCEFLLAQREKVALAEQRHQQQEEALQKMEEDRVELLQRCDAADVEQERIASRLLPELIDTATLYSLHQGQVQDETAAITSDFRTSRLRWTNGVADYNDLIIASAVESGKLRNKIVKRRRRMKELEFETRRLQFCIGTLRLELRQLHTLRVTRLMQEWLAGDADVSEDKAIAKLDTHIVYVSENMSRKVAGLGKTAIRFRSQLSERATENAIVAQDCDALSSSVRDATAIQSLIHADGSNQFAIRAREIFETSELEELARSQQEELIRLKRSVDRLRERTFPSFAVVSKQTM